MQSSLPNVGLRNPLDDGLACLVHNFLKMLKIHAYLLKHPKTGELLGETVRMHSKPWFFMAFFIG